MKKTFYLLTDLVWVIMAIWVVYNLWVLNLRFEAAWLFFFSWRYFRLMGIIVGIVFGFYIAKRAVKDIIGEK